MKLIFYSKYMFSHKFNLYIKLTLHKSVRIWSYSGPYFPAFGLNTYSVQMRENTDWNNSECGHVLRSVILKIFTN